MVRALTVGSVTAMHCSAPPHPDVADPLRSAGAALLGAIRAGGLLSHADIAAPATLDDAYAIQNAIVAGAGPVGGWKVAPLREGGEPRCSPLPHLLFAASPARFNAGFLATCRAEVEIAICLGADLVPRQEALSMAQVTAAIATIHPAIELLSSRFSEADTAPDLSRLADLQSCAGVVIGAGRTDWHEIALSDLSIEIALDTELRQASLPKPSLERTLAAIGWLAVHASKRGLHLKRGDIVMTGARLGPLALASIRKAIAHIEALGETTICVC
ncbi:fumarylacetoacetate hydrolase family protein [Bosea sp. 685]|uniref:fumarylacetoacetate hydrolase family protein n=1 Tax=Bosea sp. 685 TaxID=3080057 RepID=UPI002893333F|nr:fumarylacetoacetate hydrolase family protein [Bosea sp. 685]WNJ88495.1 fumarylacetoacetate hydrolase family protein [Bosea sp. 685]